MSSSLTLRIERLRDLLDRAGWDDRRGNAGIEMNVHYGKKPYDGVNAAAMRPAPIEKWCAHVDNFRAWDDDAERAVSKLEQLVHDGVRSFVVGRVERARQLLSAAEEVMRRVETGG